MVIAVAATSASVTTATKNAESGTFKKDRWCLSTFWQQPFITLCWWLMCLCVHQTRLCYFQVVVVDRCCLVSSTHILNRLWKTNLLVGSREWRMDLLYAFPYQEELINKNFRIWNRNHRQLRAWNLVVGSATFYHVVVLIYLLHKSLPPTDSALLNFSMIVLIWHLPRAINLQNDD